MILKTLKCFSDSIVKNWTEYNFSFGKLLFPQGISSEFLPFCKK